MPRAVECAAAVQAAGVACMIGFQRRFDPTFAEAQARLARGEIGVPEMLVVTSRDPGAPPAQYLKGSGGIFRDMLIHDFDIFRWILCSDIGDGGDAADTLYANGSVLVDPEIAKVGDIDSQRGHDPHEEGPPVPDQHQPARRLRLRPALRGAGLQGPAAMRQPPADRGGAARRQPREEPTSPSTSSCSATARPTGSRWRTSSRACKAASLSAPTIADGVEAQKLADAATQSWQAGGTVVRL